LSNADLGVSEPQAPELTNIKLGMGDYVGHITPHAKIHNNHPSGGILVHV